MPATMASATTAASATKGRENEVQAGIVLAATRTATVTRVEAAAVTVGLEIEATAGIDDPEIEVIAATGGQEIEATGTGAVTATEEIGSGEEETETETAVTVEVANGEIEKRLRGGLDPGADGPYLAKKVTEEAVTEAMVANKNASAARATTDKRPIKVARKAPGSGAALEQRRLACRRWMR